MELPRELRNALDYELAHISAKKLAKVVSELSEKYRSNKQQPLGKSFFKTQDDFKAYVAFRMPATYAAVYSALEKVREVLPRWNPETFLDAGAGPGTAMWAALEVYPKLRTATLLEREEGMIDIGKGLAKYSPSPVIQNAEWIKTNITGDWHVPNGDLPPVSCGNSHEKCGDLHLHGARQPHFDLVTASYVLGELDEQVRETLVRKLWQATAHTLVIIEPGTPAGFSRIKQARDILLNEGALIVAPCPGNMPCLIGEDDWCHFSQRISRTRLHRQVKAGELSYEDEKFSFIAASREKGIHVPGRVLRHPQIRKGHIEFEICTPGGICRRTVTRSNKELYRKARDLGWGSVFTETE